MEKIPNLANNHERLENVEFPNRTTFRDYSPEGKSKTLRNFFKDCLDNPNFPDTRNQMNRVMDFVSSVRELYQKGDQDIYSLGHDSKGTLYAVLSDEIDPKKAMMIRMNPFDGKDSTDVVVSSGPLIYMNDKYYTSDVLTNTAKVQFDDELGNSTMFTLTSGKEGNKVFEIGADGRISDVSSIQDARALDYEMRYDLRIPGDYRIMSDNNVSQSIESFRLSHQIQKDIAKQAIKDSATHHDGELQPS